MYVLLLEMDLKKVNEKSEDTISEDDPSCPFYKKI